MDKKVIISLDLPPLLSFHLLAVSKLYIYTLLLDHGKNVKDH